MDGARRCRARVARSSLRDPDLSRGDRPLCRRRGWGSRSQAARGAATP
jgi:hypothetical protein